MTIPEYIEANIDRSIYRDSGGSGFRGIDLPYRYTSPCIKGEGKFYFFFYWDTAFTHYALYATGREDVARDNIRNMLWLIRRQGYMPNHVGIHNRSQAPYLCRMVTEYFVRIGGREADPRFFRECAEGLLAEYNWWMSARFHPTGLNHYGTHETREGMEQFARNKRVSAVCPSAGKPIEEVRRIGAHYLANAEATCDFSPRFEHRCLDFVEPELNGLLYEYERFFADCTDALDGDFSIDWNARAETRVARMNRYLWSEERGIFMDYDGANDRHGPVAALTGLQPLAHGVATAEQARRIAANLSLFEREHGVAYTEECPGCRNFQWAYPNVWPPMVYMTVTGLDRYGYAEDARRIARKFVETSDRLFEKTGQLWEKTDAETGDVAGGEYDAAPMIGWSAGVYLELTKYLEA